MSAVSLNNQFDAIRELVAERSPGDKTKGRDGELALRAILLPTLVSDMFQDGSHIERTSHIISQIQDERLRGYLEEYLAHAKKSYAARETILVSGAAALAGFGLGSTWLWLSGAIFMILSQAFLGFQAGVRLPEKEILRTLEQQNRNQEHVK